MKIVLLFKMNEIKLLDQKRFRSNIKIECPQLLPSVHKCIRETFDMRFPNRHNNRRQLSHNTKNSCRANCQNLKTTIIGQLRRHFCFKQEDITKKIKENNNFTFSHVMMVTITLQRDYHFISKQQQKDVWRKLYDFIAN